MKESAATWVVHTWQTDDGLPNNNITALATTPDGYLWVANSGRLARFDGVSFEAFPTPALAGLDQKVTSLLQSDSGGLWAGLDHGSLVHLQGTKTRVLTENLPNLIAWRLVEQPDGALWVIYGGNTLCRIKDGNVLRLTGRPEHALRLRGGASLVRDTDGRVWLTTAGAIYACQNEEFRRVATVGDEMTAVRSCAATAGGCWLSVGNEVFRFDGAHPPTATGRWPLESANSQPTVLLEDRGGGLWVGTTSDGLFHRPTPSEPFKKVAAAHSRINALIEDKEGSVWVGTGGGGLQRFQRRGISVEGAGFGPASQSFQSIAQQRDGTLWATTDTGLLLHRDQGGVWTPFPGAPAGLPGRATCLATDKTGGLWIGTRDQRVVRLYRGQFDEIEAADGLVSRVVHALHSHSNGDLWIGGEVPEALLRWRAGQLKSYTLPKGIRIIRAMTEDAAGAVWLGTSKGVLLRVSGEEVYDETERTTGMPMSIRCLHGTPDGAVWIGYVGGGIGRYHQGKFARITSAHGLYDDVVSQIVSDREGWLWFGSDHGIFRVKQRDLEEVAQGRRAQVRSLHYGRGSGLPSLQASAGDAPSSIRTADGKLWMPMKTGIAVIDPAKIGDARPAVPVALTRVSVDDRVLAADGNVVPTGDVQPLDAPGRAPTLPPKHHRLHFHFTALTLGPTENVHFRYRLDGLDESWVEAGPQRTASYSTLPAGSYRFQVTASNNEGIWNPQSASFAFSVAPFFWNTTWFRLANVGLIAVLVGGFVRYISFRRLREKLRQLQHKAALDAERARIAKDIHDDLGGSLTQTILLLDLADRSRMDPQKTSDYLRQLSGNVRLVVDSLDEIVWAANPTNDTLAAFIDYFGQFATEFLQAANLRRRFDFPDDPPHFVLAPDIRHNLFLSLKEALNNVVRHSAATEVWISLTVSNNLLTTIVADDGRGFDPRKVPAGGNGLTNLQQRLAQIGGSCTIEAESSKGTRITFKLPLISAAIPARAITP